MAKRLSSIYILRCQRNKKLYVGSSVNGPARVKNHLTLLRTGAHLNLMLQHDWQVYGEGAFDHLMIPTTKCDLVDLEFILTLALRAFDRRRGYNIKFGPMHGPEGAIHDTERKLVRHRHFCWLPWIRPSDPMNPEYVQSFVRLGKYPVAGIWSQTRVVDEFEGALEAYCRFRTHVRSWRSELG